MPLQVVQKALLKLAYVPTSMKLSFPVKKFTPFKKCKEAAFGRYQQKGVTVAKAAPKLEPLQQQLPYRPVLQRVYTWSRDTIAAGYRRRAAETFKSGRNVYVPAFGLAGLALLSNSGEEPIQADSDKKNDDSLWNKFTAKYTTSDCEVGLNAISSCLKDYEFGDYIAKGCNGAVYAARLRENSSVESLSSAITETPVDDCDVDSELSFDILSEEVMSSEDSFTVISDENSKLDDDISCHSFGDNMAIKVLFNYSYDTEESDTGVMQWKHLQREAIPAKAVFAFGEMAPWENGNRVKNKTLPVHLNIVDMPCVMYGQWPEELLPTGLQEYPEALPPVLNPGSGFGQQSTMFLVMKRYPITLRQYLESSDPSPYIRLLLFAQLVEGITHLYHNGLAHRDIKSDNILLDFNDDDSPRVAIGDFGCCCWLEEESPVVGNRNLMAPEIAKGLITQTKVGDFSKADLWAAGTLAYEIFGTPAENPFYQQLDSITYCSDQLPMLKTHLERMKGKIVERLVLRMLSESPSNRPSPDMVATILAIVLWAPASWWCSHTLHVPTVSDLVRWQEILISLCHHFVSIPPINKWQLCATEYQLLLSFLNRFRLCFVQSAINDLQTYIKLITH